jgi:hypothetical protein
MSAFAKFALRFIAVWSCVISVNSNRVNAAAPDTVSVTNSVNVIDSYGLGGTGTSTSVPTATAMYTTAAGANGDNSVVTVTSLVTQSASGGSMTVTSSSLRTFVPGGGSNGIMLTYMDGDDTVHFSPSDAGHIYFIWASSSSGVGMTAYVATTSPNQFPVYQPPTGRFEGSAGGLKIEAAITKHSIDSSSGSSLGNVGLYWSFNGWPGESLLAPFTLATGTQTSPGNNREQSIYNDNSGQSAGLWGNDWVVTNTSQPSYTSTPSPWTIAVNPGPNPAPIISKFSTDKPVSTVTITSTGQSAEAVFQGCNPGNTGALCINPGNGAASGDAMPDADGFIRVPLIPGQEFNFLDYASQGVTQFLLTGVDAGTHDNPIDLNTALKFTSTGETKVAVTTYTTTADPFALLGDYNHDGVTDIGDYVVWRKSFGQSGAALAADGDASGQIDDADLAVWRAHFGYTSGGSGTTLSTVPEPSTFLLTISALIFRARRRKLAASNHI